MVLVNQVPQSIRLPLDQTVQRQASESLTHWGMKAAIVRWLKEHPHCEGTIKTEKKVEDLIADVRCKLSKAPTGIPQRVVIEVQTSNSKKNILQRTSRYHQFGFSVFWVFHVNAIENRRDAEKSLRKHMSEPPSLGLISLEEGELQLGCPVTPQNFESPSPKLAYNELYVPTYHRKKLAFDHGDFKTNGKRLAFVSIENQMYIMSQIRKNGQRTLPQPAPWNQEEFSRAIRLEEIKRVGPVRGPP